jgi:hypothetical protein
MTVQDQALVVFMGIGLSEKGILMNKDYKAMRKERVNYIFHILNENDCEGLSIQYSGGGDDGQIELGHISGKDETKVRIALDEPTIFNSMYYESEESSDLFHIIEEVSEHFINELGIDWVNGLGSSGEVFFDVKKKDVTVSYQVMEEKEAVFTQ